MFSKNEMKALQHISRGIDRVTDIAEAMGISASRVYRVVASLNKKGVVHLENGTVVPERQPYLSMLLTILRDSEYSAEALSGNGMEILAEMTVPRTVTELSVSLEEDRRTVLSRLTTMRKVSMVVKNGNKYDINRKIWPELVEVANEYQTYREHIDLRAPAGSRLYFENKDYVVFSDNRSLKDYSLTAFSRYTEFGVQIHLRTKYYCNAVISKIDDIFLHSLYVISKNNDWRLKMFALIFYKKYKNELTNIKHPLVTEMELVLSTKEGKVSGWVPLKEMQERAEMYGVDLYGN